MPSPAGRSRRVFALRLIVSASVLTVLLLMVPFRDIVAALRRAPPGVCAAALAAYMLAHLIGVLKWRLVINTAGAGLGFSQALRCYYYGLFGSVFLPSIVGGDVVRAGLAIKLARSKSGLLLGSLADRLIDTVGLAGVAGIGVLLLPAALDPRSRRIFLALAVALALFGICLAGAFLVLPVVRQLSFGRRRLLVKVRQAATALRRRPGRLASALTLGMLLQALLIAVNAWLGAHVGIHVSFVVWLFVWPLAKMAALLPLTQGGIGVREGAIVILFQPFGVSSAAALVSGLIFTAVVMTGGLLSGLVAFLAGRRDSLAVAAAAAVRS